MNYGTGISVPALYTVPVPGKMPVELTPETNQFPPNREQIHPKDIERVTEQLYLHLAGETPHLRSGLPA